MPEAFFLREGELGCREALRGEDARARSSKAVPRNRAANRNRAARAQNILVDCSPTTASMPPTEDRDGERQLSSVPRHRSTAPFRRLNAKLRHHLQVADSVAIPMGYGLEFHLHAQTETNLLTVSRERSQARFPRLRLPQRGRIPDLCSKVRGWERASVQNTVSPHRWLSTRRRMTPANRSPARFRSRCLGAASSARRV